MTAHEYKDFMFNESNIQNCESCPDNINASAWPGGRLPCGQFHCWVAVHCERLKEKTNE